jgi:hypothetical protein
MSRCVVFSLLALSGCSAHAVDVSLTLEEEEAAGRRFAGYEHAPEGAPRPAPEPVLERVEHGNTPAAPRIVVELGREYGPPFAVSARDMPAIDVGDGTVVVPDLEILELSTAHGPFDVLWLSKTGPSTVSPVVARGEWVWTREMSTRTRELNERLRERSWRKMEPLPVEYMHPDDHPDFYRERTAPHERPVQVLTRHGELIVRILGVRVLERHLVGTTDMLHALYADRETGTIVAVFMACVGEDCTCDPVFTVQRMQFDLETLQVIDRHPCREDHRGDCGPVDYGYAGVEPWG